MLKLTTDPPRRNNWPLTAGFSQWGGPPCPPTLGQELTAFLLAASRLLPVI
jgi:hypothetical protein